MRSLAHVTAASLIVLALGACADKQVPTSMPVGGRVDAAAPPPGGGTQPPRPPIPPLRPGPNDIMELTAGDGHTCGRTYDLTVFCWGDNSWGQAGTWASTLCNGITCVSRPTIATSHDVNGTVRIRGYAIDAGSNHTCMLEPGGYASCWGSNSNGQAGYGFGGYNKPYEARRVAGANTFSYLSAGGNATCGAGSGGVFCWGNIANNATSPTLVSGYGSAFGLTVGARHACIIEGTGYGTTHCWGNNQYGQLSRDPATVPSALFGQQYTTFSLVRRIATQQNFTCVDRTDGAVECVGENNWGQLGYGVTGPPASPGQPQIVGGGKQLHGVSTSYGHACALDASNMAWCWGYGNNGQVGNGSVGVFNTPQAVAGGHTYIAIAAGGSHTCAIGTDNHIYCWGLNNAGQLGTNAPGGSVSSPVQALDPIEVLEPQP
jgi:alpha-tubulin suppressor-like RCC1 family protein